MIVLTADQDWAPPWATEQLCRRWTERGFEGTLFVTHECSSLESLRTAGAIELAWHPHFAPGSTQGSTEALVLDHLAELVPESVGVRAHGLNISTSLLQEYARRGLIYEGSYLLEGAPGLTPVVGWNGLVRLPIFWEDDVHLLHGREMDLGTLDLERPGLKIFNFHPIHVALNSAGLGAYGRLKAILAREGRDMTGATPEEVESCRGATARGAGDLLDELLDWLSIHPELKGGTMRHVAQRARAETGWGEP